MNKKKLKLFTITNIILILLILPIINTYNLLKSIKKKISTDKYVNFNNSGFMKLSSNNNNNINLMKNYIPKKSILYLWESPQFYDEVATECNVAEINYFLYPITLKFGARNFKTPYDYISCTVDNIEELNLYLTFFDMDKFFVNIASDKQIVILKKIEKEKQ